MEKIDIFSPILEELGLLDKEIQKFKDELLKKYKKDVVDYVFKVKGKRLRPSLLILSAANANEKVFKRKRRKIILVALALELIHNASLIHDDIIDEDDERRGMKTLNKTFGNSVAVLTGDLIVIKALYIVSKNLNKSCFNIVFELAENMCMAELGVVSDKNTIETKDDYLRLIKYKTAFFMRFSCKLGAKLITSDEYIIKSLEMYGLNVGMAYQIVDDYIDQDPIFNKFANLDDAKYYLEQANDSIKNINDSEYKKCLINFSDYIINSANN